MEPEDQVCSAELASRLKTLGVQQASYFYWYRGNVLRANQLTQELRRGAPPVSAFTVSELGSFLPKPLMGRMRHRFGFDEYGWYIELCWQGKGTRTFHAATEADARAQMLVHLLENNLIQPTPEGASDVLEEKEITC